ncbi:Protein DETOXIFICATION 47 [Durusdinium trenchii]|uniref:Protein DETOXIFICATION n=1 Tax=Durusdinium trenchii TaxID=1381693 RepID=A0ABP0LGP3_9DINO
MYATGLAGGKPCVRFLAPSPPRPPRPRVLRRADAEFSKKEMLKFAIPALGISIASPFMTNIDNAFVGRLSGTKALAAMSPGSVLSDYILYLFVFLPRATTGLVARALPWGRPKAAQRLGTALSTALVLGTVLTAVYVFATPLLLNLLDVAPELRPGAGTYVRVRGLVAWAALMQSVALSGLLAAKDSLTPLKVVLFAALLNLLGDFFLCAWPFHWGIFGAALATSISTLMGFRMMWRALRRNRLMPGHLSMPKREELQPLLEYAKPLSVVILFRFMSLTFMAKCAGMMGTAVTAAYQVLANVIVLFGLFGEPLSQTAQTMLPGLLDRPSREARELMKNLAVVALGIAGSVGLLSAVALKASAQLFTTDPQVQGILRGTTMVPVTVASLILSQVCDGAMLAAREFPLVIKITVVATSFQVLLLMAATHFNWSLEAVFLSLSIRYWLFLAIVCWRCLTGCGALGRALQSRQREPALER